MNKPNYAMEIDQGAPGAPAMERPARDARIFPGGPYKSEIESWKAQYGEVYLTEAANDFYVWRVLNRYEYKHIMQIPNITPMQREELICEQCVLWPKDYTFEVMANGKAGIPALIAEQIMHASGFDRSSVPQLL